MLKIAISRFNTSYVSVQAVSMKRSELEKIEFQYILCFGSRQELQEQEDKAKRFQYILCFGSRWYDEMALKTVVKVSIHPMFRFKKKNKFLSTRALCFNTSYVSVQDQAKIVWSASEISFNTSYVSVQDIRRAIKLKE